LRDFHAASRDRPILPVLWCMSAPKQQLNCAMVEDGIAQIHRIGAAGMGTFLVSIPSSAHTQGPLMGEAWDAAPYRPVPTIVEAATAIFSGHDVRAISCADASNLTDAAACIVERVVAAKREGRHALLFLTGVPGSGKTLAGLQAV